MMPQNRSRWRRLTPAQAGQCFFIVANETRDFASAAAARQPIDWVNSGKQSLVISHFPRAPKLRVEINEEKSRLANLAKGDSFGFLGFEFRRILCR
jgi:hypothetical protein